MNEYERISINCKTLPQLQSLLGQKIITNDIETIRYIIEKKKFFTDFFIEDKVLSCVKPCIIYENTELLIYFLNIKPVLETCLKESVLNKFFNLCVNYDNYDAARYLVNNYDIPDNNHIKKLRSNYKLLDDIFKLKLLNDKLSMNLKDNNDSVKTKSKI